MTQLKESLVCTNHPSISEISMRNQLRGTFSFRCVTYVEVCEQMANLDANKYTGHDNIPPKIVKMCRDKIAVSFTSFIKHCINDCHVPIDMKLAEIDPILKKDNYV